MQIETPNFTAIERITKISEEQMKLTQQSGNEGIKNIITKTRLDHAEECIADTIWKIISQYNDVYT